MSFSKSLFSVNSDRQEGAISNYLRKPRKLSRVLCFSEQQKRRTTWPGVFVVRVVLESGNFNDWFFKTCLYLTAHRPGVLIANPEQFPRFADISCGVLRQLRWLD